MKDIERDFIELTNRAINQIPGNDGFFDCADWKGILELAYKNGLAAVVLDVARQVGVIPDDLLKQWEATRLQIYLRQAKHLHALMDLLFEMNEAKIDYAVFKGPIVAECYPNPLYRISSDSDILIDSSDRVKVCGMIEKRGYLIMEHETKEQVFVYKNERTGHKIELHTSVFEDYKGSKIEIIKGAGIDKPEHRINVRLKEGKIRTFGVNEHLVYLVFHMIKHFVLEGANVRFFTDITLFINKNVEAIDFAFFWNWMDKCNYTVFCENFFSICISKFGMNDGIMRGHKAEADESVLEKLLLDFIYVGDEKQKRGESWQLTATMEPYLVGERTSVKKGKFARLIAYLFPSVSQLNENYEYARRCQVLLPVAWVHRFCHKAFWQIFNKREGSYSGMQKVEIVESRLGLLGSVGLLDEEK